MPLLPPKPTLDKILRRIKEAGNKLTTVVYSKATGGTTVHSSPATTSIDASEVATDVTNFDGNFDSTFTNVQLCLDLIDDMAGGSTDFADNLFRIHDNGDSSKKLAFEVSGISASTVRTLTPPNYDGTIATLAGSETLTNKTLTTPTISGTGFTNAQHAHTGASSGGTLDAAAIASGTLPLARGGTNATTAAGARLSLLNALTGNALKVLRVNSGETDTEWATVSAGVTGSGTDDHLARWDGTGAIQDTNWSLADTDKLSLSSSINTDSLLSIENTSTTNPKCLELNQSGSTGTAKALQITMSSTSNAATGIDVSANGGGSTNPTYGIKVDNTNTNNASYSLHAGTSIRVGTHIDIASESAPAAPPTGYARIFYDSSGYIYYENDAGTIFGPLTQFSQNTYLTPVGMANSASATRSLATQVSYIVYVGKAAKAFTSCNIDLRIISASAGTVTKNVVGILTGQAPAFNSTATLTCRGSATYTNTNNTTQTVPVTVSGILPGDDIWAAIYVYNSVSSGTMAGMVADLLTTGANQVYNGDFTAMSGTPTTNCAASTDTPPYLVVRVV